MNEGALLNVLRETLEAVHSINRDVECIKDALLHTPLLRERFEDAAKRHSAIGTLDSVGLLLERVKRAIDQR